LGSGGFSANPAMRAQFLGAGWDLAKVRGTKYNTGDGIQMALDIGAQPFGHWSGGHATPIDADAGDYEGGFLDPANRRFRTHRYAWPLGIMVNTEGRRFVDEGEDFHAYTYAKTGAEILKQPGGIAYQIFDEKLKEAVSRYLYDGTTPVIANTIRELAEMLEINPDALQKTVDEFNTAVVEDRPFDEVIRDGRHTEGVYPPKSNWSQKLDTPPFTAYAATCGLTFTYGGLKINTDCQVLNKSDRPIRGLYAAGELTAGFFFYNYPSGSGLLRGAVTGKIAGTNAASQR
jgi:tricarballylate dehydrogenase